MPIGLLDNEFIQQLRKSLLERNLNPTAEANLGGVGSSNNTRGQPANTASVTPYVPLNSDTVSSLGFYQLKNLSLKNRYAPLNFEPVDITTTFAVNGNVGTYENYTRTIVPQNLNLKSYVLNSPNIINYNDTPLGVIGANQLKFSLETNVAQNVIKNTAGRINLNIFSLINGEELLIRDYQISQFPNTGLGFFGNLVEKYSGIQLPFPIIPESGFAFLNSLFNGKVNYADCNLQSLDDTARMGSQGTVTRNNELLRFTGKGNRIQLFNMLGTNKYRPNYDSQNGGGILNRVFGFLQQQKDNDAASYDTLEKTRRSSGVLDIMAIQNIAVDAPGKILSNSTLGAFTKNDTRSVLQENGLPKITWTDKDKPGVFKKFMFSIENLAWIGYTDGLPECEIGNGDTNSNDKRPGRIMWFPPYDLTFDESVSVAWDKTNFIGRGEPIFTYNNTTRSGTIKFKVVVDHPSIINELRNQPSYTDSDFNKFFAGCKTPTNYVDAALQYLTVKRPTSSFGVKEQDRIETKIVKDSQKNAKKEFNDTTPGSTETFKIKIFFPNANSNVNTTYEPTGVGAGSFPVDPELISKNLVNVTTYNNTSNFQLNATNTGFLSNDIVTKINDINTNKNDILEIKVVIRSSSTNIGGSQINDILNKNRYTSASTWIKGQFSSFDSEGKLKIEKGSSVITNIGSSTNHNDQIQKEGRFALLEIEVVKKNLTPSSTDTVSTDTFDNKDLQDSIGTILLKTYANVYAECDYFYYLEKNVPFIFDKFREKIKYFHPGFHSTTPEGLNSRLTFLHQCTRQGPAISDNGGKSNLAFGRPPICILRIGDFFHTKMVIESMSISYDEGVLWDLNPEGIGVQPRLATVSLTVSYLGGQSLYAPIRQLQNALGFNFYANTEVFQHAPYVVSTEEIIPEIRTEGVPLQSALNSRVPEPFNPQSLLNGIPGINQSRIQIPFREGVIPVDPTLLNVVLPTPGIDINFENNA